MTHLHIKNLSISIEKRTLIKNLTMTCSPGEVWGILGDNGTGKTTLLHVLAGLEKPTQGEVSVNDKINILNLKPKTRAQKIGILFQETLLNFPNTVFDTVMTGRFPYQKNWFFDEKEQQEDVEKKLKTMQLQTLSNRLVNTLSGGEKQRVAIATLLTQDPNIFLLDEPTNHLDTKQRIRTLKLFQKLAKKENKTVIMVLHEMDLIENFCDKRLEIKE